MKKSKHSPISEKRLTDVELELMTILWHLGEGTVTEVQESLPSSRTLAYTSISTILRILEQKSVLRTRKEGRGHIYIPVLQKRDYEATTVKHVVERVFNGTPVALVKQLLATVDLDENEWHEIKKLVSQKGAGK